MRALMSMLEAMPARSPGTAPVVVLVTGVLVRPRPMPASRQPGRIVSQLAASTRLPHSISKKPTPMTSKPAGMTASAR
ncbi:hypothetical protein D3C72_2441200 [compost metagenome]